MALTATILALVILSLAMASNWFLALLIFLGILSSAVVATGLMRRNSTSSASAGESARESERANGSMAFLIFLQVVACAVVAAGKKRRNQESSSSGGINHEVFLNFRGKDTRKEFTDILYKKLKNMGIEVFKDDKNLRSGEEINQGLKDAIKRSRISIAIFSKDYASSKSCLMELVQMWECRESNGQIVIPIFYNVSPYAVKHQAEDFAKSFEKHEADERVDSNTIKTWKKVLQQVGVLSGFDRALINGGHVSDLLEEVGRRVWQLLWKDDQDVTDKLVGIDLHVQDMMTKLGVVYSQGQATKVCGEDVRVIRICGMPGVGKTTLAKFVYNKIHPLFHAFCFLEGFNSEGVESSREKLIAGLQKENRATLRSCGDGRKKMESLFTRMKVLIVVDDVREDEQFEELVGTLSWFGQGSRIIVTTDRRDVLKVFDGGVVEECRVEPMQHHHALQLFRKHVFQGDAPPDVPEYESLSRDTVKAIGGLPMAIVFQAKYLKRVKEIELWRSNLEYLNKHQQDKKAEAVFEASYKLLDDSTREIFLDIACFFIGKDERIPPYMWEDWDCDPPREIKHLRDMHFLEDGENKKLRMHDMLRDFGRKLVKRKALHRRCRFWNHSDALSILEDGKVDKVQGIGLTVKDGHTTHFTCEKFRKMSNLRYLGLGQATIRGETKNLPPNLRWIDWQGCHFIPELCNIDLKKLVILDLSRSPVTKDSRVWRQIMEKVKELKVLNLQGCDLLGASLKFSAKINLEILILEDCTRLYEIGTFISKLERLKSLNLRNCRGVKQLPQELHRMKFLTELIIDGTGIKRIHIENDSLRNLKKLSACDCKELKGISTIGHLTELTSLDLDGASIDWDPETFEFPRKLQRLSLRNCGNLDELPPSIGKLGLLEIMDLSDTKITELPESVKYLSNLKTLKMASTHLQKFPKDIAKLGKLEEIDFSLCRSLKEQVCCDISGLNSLRILRLSSSNVAGLPESIRHLSRLQTLDILKCSQLQALPKLPSSLLCLHWGSKNMTVPDLSYLTNLKDLCLKEVEQPKGGLLNLKSPVRWIASLTSLETLELSLSTVTNLPGNFRALTQLRELTLSYMDLTQLPSSSSLWTLHLKHCKIQGPTFSGLRYLSELELEHSDLAEIDGLEDLTLLEVLKISHCDGITNLNGLEGSRRLRKVEGVFSAQPSLPIFSHPVKVDICIRDSSSSVA